MRHAITTSPEALTGISAGTRYAFQNQSGRSIYIARASGTPSDLDDAANVPPSGPLSVGFFAAESGENIYVWGSTATGHLFYDEAP